MLRFVGVVVSVTNKCSTSLSTNGKFERIKYKYMYTTQDFIIQHSPVTNLQKIVSNTQKVVISMDCSQYRTCSTVCLRVSPAILVATFSDSSCSGSTRRSPMPRSEMAILAMHSGSVETTYNFFVVSKSEIVLYNIILVSMDGL